jgi:3-hydroxymyristoyl/3-hydroxydecanoyl-(acyl carrier protein) dehydratase
MLSKWHSLECGSGDELEGMKALAFAPSGSPWFDGHFPDQPILPGIAMIAMAFDVARHKEAQKGINIRLISVKRVRFKKPVRPDEPFTLVLSREQKELGISYHFIILLNEEAVCTGMLTVEQHAA